MIYPSDLLHQLADKVDPIEDKVIDWFDERNLSFWNWPLLLAQKGRLEYEKEELLKRYVEMYLQHEQCTRRGTMPQIVRSFFPTPLEEEMLAALIAMRIKGMEETAR